MRDVAVCPDRRDAQWPLGLRPRLLDLHPFHRPRPVAAVLQPPMQDREVVVSVRSEARDGHPIDATAPLVRLHLLPRLPQVPHVVDLADQRVGLPCLHVRCPTRLLHSPSRVYEPTARPSAPASRSLPRQPSVRSRLLARSDVALAVPDVAPSPWPAPFGSPPASPWRDGPEAFAVPRFLSTVGHSDFSHGIPGDFA